MGRRAKDRRLARHACLAGVEDSSGAWDAGDEQGIPVVPESRKRVLRAKLGATLHRKIRARRERPFRKDAMVLFVPLSCIA